MEILNTITVIIIFLSAFLNGRTEAVLECLLTHAGHDYMGTRNQSVSGFPCQRWDSQTPHGHMYTNPVSYPDSTVSDASNYCRNPDQDWGGGTWCFLDMPQYRWQRCDIPLCDCKTDTDGYDYIGETSHTASGLECQYWDSLYPHPHNFTEGHQFPDRDLIDAENSCRNPDSHRPAGPWCYTLDPDVEYEYCNIDFCDGYPITTAAPTTTTPTTTTPTTTTPTTTTPTTTTPTTTTPAATTTAQDQDNEETTPPLSTTSSPTTSGTLSSSTPSPSVSNHSNTHTESTSTYQTKHATTTTKPTGKVPEPKVKGSTSAQGAGRTAGIAMGVVFGIIILAGAGGGFIWWRYYRGQVHHRDDRGIMENFDNPLYDKPKGTPRPVSDQGAHVNQGV